MPGDTFWHWHLLFHAVPTLPQAHLLGWWWGGDGATRTPQPLQGLCRCCDHQRIGTEAARPMLRPEPLQGLCRCCDSDHQRKADWRGEVEVLDKKECQRQ